MFLKKVINKGYEAEICSICETGFSLMKFTRIHKCKRCNRFVCSSCSKGKQLIFQQSQKLSQKKHRICDNCKDQQSSIELTIANYQMKWASTSNFSISWESKIQQDYQYDHYLKLFFQNKTVYQESFDTIEKDVFLGRTDFIVFNNSLKIFFYSLQKDKSKQSIRRNITNVLSALTSKFPNLGYCQGMSGIAAFLLNFSSETQAFSIFCDIIQNIVPENLYLKSNSGTNLIGLLAQTYFLTQFYIGYFLPGRNIKLEQEDSDRMKTLIELVTAKCLITLFVGPLSFKNTLFVWNQLKMQRSYVVIEKALITIVFLFQQKVLEQNTPFKVIESIIEFIDHNLFVKTYQSIDITLDIKNKLINTFYSNFANQWNNKQDKYSIKKLTMFCKFKENQLKLILEEFSELINQNQHCPGINRVEFLQFLKLYDDLCQESEPKFLNELGMSYFENIFEVFDQQKIGYLDFREFVCCVSLNLKGNIKDKLNILTQSLKTNQGYIHKNKFQKLMESLFQIIKRENISSQQISDIQESFKNRINAFFSLQEQISVNQLYIIANDPFITEIAMRAKENKEQGIAARIVQALHQINTAQ